MRTYAPLEDLIRSLPDVRLSRSLDPLIETFSEKRSMPIPQTTPDRNALDPYFDNFHITPNAILVSCLPETLSRLDGCPRTLAIQDTSDLNFSGLSLPELGYTAGSKIKGFRRHSTLVVSPDGLSLGPGTLGLLTHEILTRDPADKGHAQDCRNKNAKNKESDRCPDQGQAPRNLPVDSTVVLIAQAHRNVVAEADGTKGKLAGVVRACALLGTYELDVPRAADQPASRADGTRDGGRRSTNCPRTPRSGRNCGACVYG